MNFQQYIDAKSLEFQRHLKVILNKNRNIASPSLFEAMRYSILNNGKYIRPLIIFCVGNSLGVQDAKLISLAVAIELIHTYSLIHDDLPAMDNATLRRGNPCCHLKFGEAEAILAGDALRMLAIEVIADSAYLGDQQKLKLIRLLAGAAGAKGMVAGQSLDILAENKTLDLEKLREIHDLKTGKLIQACVKMPALLTKNLAQNNLEKLAALLGIAYQIQDDLLDVESSTALLGKDSGIDAKLMKNTYPKLMGLAQAKEHLASIKKEIQLILVETDLCTSKLALLVEYIFERTH